MSPSGTAPHHAAIQKGAHIAPHNSLIHNLLRSSYRNKAIVSFVRMDEPLAHADVPHVRRDVQKI